MPIDCNDCPLNKSKLIFHVKEDGTYEAIDFDCFDCKNNQLIAAEAEIERLEVESNMHLAKRNWLRRSIGMALYHLNNKQYHAAKEVLLGEDTGHWTTEPPTDPGWYKVYWSRETEPRILEVKPGTFPKLYVKVGKYIFGLVHGRKWYSEKETFPPLPESEEL